MTKPPTAEARPKRDTRRDAILITAHEVFLEQGFDGASMSSIAARLGGSKGTLYSYFDSKEALFEALVAESCARHGGAIFEPVSSRPMAERLTTMAVAYLNLVLSEWAIRMLQIVAVEARRRPEIGRLFWEAGPANGIDRLSRQIDGFVAAGDLAVDDSRDAAATFLVLCRGSLHLRRVLGQESEPTPAVIDAASAHAVAQFLKLYAVS